MKESPSQLFCISGPLRGGPLLLQVISTFKDLVGKSTYLNQGNLASWLQEVFSPGFLEVLDVLEFASCPGGTLQLPTIT